MTKEQETKEKKEKLSPEEVAEQTEVQDQQAGKSEKLEKVKTKEKIQTEKPKLKEKQVPQPHREPRGKEIVATAKIFASYNNTIIHIVDVAGNTIAKSSGGQVTKYDRLEASPTVAMFVAKKVALEAKEKGVTALHIRIRSKGGHEGPHNPGPGAQAALKSFSRVGMRIKSIVDVTPVAYGGCRKPHGRRGRRV